MILHTFHVFGLIWVWIAGVSGSDVMVREKQNDSGNKVCLKCEEMIGLQAKEIYQQQKEISQQQKEINQQQKEINQQQKEMINQQKKINSLESEINNFQTRLNNVEKQGQQPKTSEGGVTYVRWGRTVCSDASTMVYRGYIGGNSHANKGGGTNYLCLPHNPDWGNKMDGSQVSANIQGAEYEFAHFESIFSRTYNGGRSLHDHDAPCVVCLAPSRSAQLMVPAKRTCPSGWTLEYRGYLVTDHPNHNVKDFVCLDEEPEALPGSQANQNGALFYTVEAICGSLPCPPYVNGWELTCAVCTK